MTLENNALDVYIGTLCKETLSFFKILRSSTHTSESRKNKISIFKDVSIKLIFKHRLNMEDRQNTIVVKGVDIYGLRNPDLDVLIGTERNNWVSSATLHSST